MRTTVRRRVTAAAIATCGLLLAGLTVLPGAATPERDHEVLAPALAVAEPPPSSAVTSTTLPPLPPLTAGALTSGAEGPEVEALETRLAALHYDPGDVDGAYDHRTVTAVMAFEKVVGMEPTGRVDPLVWAALAGAEIPSPLMPDGGAERVEVDLARQLLFLYERNELRLVTHVSTGSGRRYCAPGGCGTAITPVGAHRFMWRVNGWRTSRLGRLYNPVYFTGGGVAVHGFPSVPTHPASHGCVRIPMHVAEYFPSLVEEGDPVYVLDGVTPVAPLAPGEPGEGEAEGGPPVTPTTEPEPGLAPSEGWLDGEPPPSSTTTIPAGLLA